VGVWVSLKRASSARRRTIYGQSCNLIPAVPEPIGASRRSWCVRVSPMKQGRPLRRPEDCDSETNRNADSNEWTEDPELIMPPVSTNVGRVPLVKLHFSPPGSEVSSSTVLGAALAQS